MLFRSQRYGRTMGRTGNQLGAGVPGTTYRCHPGGPNDYVFIFAQQQMWHPLLRAVASGFWGLLGRPASEYGRLCRGGGGPRTGRASPEGASVAYAPLSQMLSHRHPREG